MSGKSPIRCSSVAQSSTAASGCAAWIAATSSARFFFEGGLRGRISVVMPGPRALRAEAYPLQVIVPALRGHVLPAGLLGDPAGHRGSGPQATARCRTLDRGCQFLLLLGREQGRPLGGDEREAVIPQTLRAFAVVPAHDPAGIVFLQPNERGCIRGGLAVSDEGVQLPAPRFEHRLSMAGKLAQFGRR